MIRARCAGGHGKKQIAREGLGFVLTFDKLVDTSRESRLCFRPLKRRNNST